MIPLIGAVVSTVAGLFSNWQKKKLIESEGKIEIAKAEVQGKIENVRTQTQQEGDYNVQAQKGMAASWKDEFITIIVWGFFVACFIPPLQPHIKAGLVFLKSCAPWWLEYTLIGTVISSFGLKGWKFWELKKSITNGNGNGNGN